MQFHDYCALLMHLPNKLIIIWNLGATIYYNKKLIFAQNTTFTIGTKLGKIKLSMTNVSKMLQPTESFANISAARHKILNQFRQLPVRTRNSFCDISFVAI